MKTTINITGMSCGHCTARVKKALEEMGGVLWAEVSLENNRAEIEFDESAVSVQQLKDTIEDAGYSLEL